MSYFSPGTAKNLVDTLSPGRSYRPKKGGGGERSQSIGIALGSKLDSKQLQGIVAKQLGQIAKCTPEAVMKITGKQASAQHVTANLAYIGRLDRGDADAVPIEDERGQVVEGRGELKQIAQEWAEFNERGGDRRTGAVSRSMVLSSPRGSDPAKVLDAAREWAQKELGDRRWVMALHTDTPNPHVHITYAIRDNNLKRSYPNRQDLAQQREAWARELCAKGIEVIATPRKARGVVAEKESTAQHRQAERDDAPGRAPSRYLKFMAAQREKVIDVFKSAIADLQKSAEADAPAIATSLSTFVAGLEQNAARDRGEPARAAPPDRVLPTERQQILAEARDERAHRERIADRDVGTAGRSPPDRSPEREASTVPAAASPDRAAADQAAPDRQDRRSAEKNKAEIVELAGEMFDLSKFDPESAKILRESAEEERESNTIELGGERLDLRRYDDETAKILKQAAKEEREAMTKQVQPPVNKVPDGSKDASSTQQQGPPRPENAIDRVIKDMEERDRERARDRERGGPSR